VALGQDFSEYFGFPCQFSFHRLLHNHHHLSSGAGTIGQQWPTYQVDSVSPHPEKLMLPAVLISVLDRLECSSETWLVAVVYATYKWPIALIHLTLPFPTADSSPREGPVLRLVHDNSYVHHALNTIRIEAHTSEPHSIADLIQEYKSHRKLDPAGFTIGHCNL
jgi:hypothetical protein